MEAGLFHVKTLTIGLYKANKYKLFFFKLI